MDPRILLFSVFATLAGILIIRQPERLAFVLLVLLGVLFLGRLSISGVLKSILPSLPYLLIIVVLNIFWNPLGDIGKTLFSIWSVTITSADVLSGITLLERFLAIILTINIASGSLSTSAMLHGMEDILIPFKWIGISVQDLVLSIQVAIRFTPILTRSAERIAKAQASRGAEWGETGFNLLARIRQVIPVIVPLFVTSLQRADTLAMAMDSRGYNLKIKKTRMISYPFHPSHLVSLVILLLLLTGLIIL
jgi:energy-coupling factor transport system permease protein